MNKIDNFWNLQNIFFLKSRNFLHHFLAIAISLLLIAKVCIEIFGRWEAQLHDERKFSALKQKKSSLENYRKALKIF